MPERGRTTRDQESPQDDTETVAAVSPGLRDTAALRRTGLIVTLLLGGLAATPPLAMDMYLPALPEVTNSCTPPPRPCNSPSPPASRAWRSDSWSSAR